MDSSYFFRASLLDQLHNGQWQVGERLPTEREFGEQYQISRSTVRKVLAEMKAQGLIAQTVGSGTYVTDKAAAWTGPARSAPAPEAAWQTSPAELMEARMALEPAIIEMVIGNATPADFEQMANCCDRAEAATSVEEFEVWDGMFHEVIARAAHNSFVAKLFKLMNQARAQGEWGMLKKRSLTPERRLSYQLEHRALLQALKARDPVQAKALAIEHLVHVRRNLLNY
ncbi:FadR/GntR family transcriptional regulator [Limnohabitans sp. yimb22184]|uniref:FadR/GntR family transcriptional regulator n=1 Tax=Limnohabitans sp. YIMB22184 TaxID=3374104 RepID=UPI003A83C5FA